eukprot:CAMPEP_0185166798 /NCGR_PEP_ID=MMETSP1139-20130426/13228_1 /TAXON_ID=298111 /ORGANISM="Pavlova sp., Strain CCMP459" /LENGTH=107 /DNA_ID=CAMNT_0027732259 /DNA_START=200 /DNA_END=523 /DNA_ORIENTATION=-
MSSNLLQTYQFLCKELLHVLRLPMGKGHLLLDFTISILEQHHWRSALLVSHLEIPVFRGTGLQERPNVRELVQASLAHLEGCPRKLLASAIVILCAATLALGDERIS